MENITATFEDLFSPYKGILIYLNKTKGDNPGYFESFDFSEEGRPMNFHPLTDKESMDLRDALYPAHSQSGFLRINGLIPKYVLRADTGHHGFAVWYTGARKVPLFFKDNLDIPSGCAHVPPLLWKADREQLWLFALKDGKRPTLTTKLNKAPFFNIHGDGQVCMGDIVVKISEDCSLNLFMDTWQRYFFGSYFSHLIGNVSPVTCNIVQLWKGLITNGGKFPMDVLKESSITIKNLLR